MLPAAGCLFLFRFNAFPNDNHGILFPIPATMGIGTHITAWEIWIVRQALHLWCMFFEESIAESHRAAIVHCLLRLFGGQRVIINTDAIDLTGEIIVG